MSSVCVSVILLSTGGPHGTITHDFLDLTVYSPLPWSLSPDIKPGTPSSPPISELGPQAPVLIPLLLTSGGYITGDLFKLVPLRTSPTSNIWWWPLKNMRFASGWYASYWNAVNDAALFCNILRHSKRQVWTCSFGFSSVAFFSSSIFSSFFFSGSFFLNGPNGIYNFTL